MAKCNFDNRGMVFLKLCKQDDLAYTAENLADHITL